MFDIGAPELLVIVIVAILVIGPKDMPMALRAAGRWIGKIRRVSGHFKSGVESMIRDAELEEMDKKWREQNEKIMAAHPGEMLPLKPEAEAGSDAGSDAGPETGPEEIDDGAVKGTQSASKNSPDEPVLPMDGAGTDNAT